MQQQVGFFWHVHHGDGLLVEWCHSYDERAEYTRTNKFPNEQGLRLRLFQYVKGQLPQEVVEAGKAYGEAGKAYNKARKAYVEARNAYYATVKKVSNETLKAYNETSKAYNEAVRVYVETEKACDEARNAYAEVLAKHGPEVEALHAEECPDCPWDGKTIFPEDSTLMTWLGGALMGLPWKKVRI